MIGRRPLTWPVGLALVAAALVGVVLVGMPALLGGCGGADERTAEEGDLSGRDPYGQPGQQIDSQVGAKIDPRTGLVIGPDTLYAAADTTQPGTYYEAKEGQFRVIWPQGCGRIQARTLTDPPGDPAGAVRTAHFFCDRKDTEQEGCAVVTYFELKGAGGGPPTPQTLAERVRDVIKNFQVETLSERPLRRGPLSGVQARCRQAETGGEVWIEGYLDGQNVYTLFAWKMTGEIFADPQYARFFSSFEVYEGK